MAEGGAGRDGPAKDAGAGDRASALAAAILRVSESLDLETVLREIVEGARRLTAGAARHRGHGRRVRLPGRARVSRDSRRRASASWRSGRTGWGWSSTSTSCRGPLRVADLPGYTRRRRPDAAADLSRRLPGRAGALPGRAGVGYLFLGEKAGGAAFTEADEEVLVLFAGRRRRPRSATRARTAANGARARTSRRSSRPRRWASWCSTAGSGALASYNREARRIVESLCEPGGTPQDMLEEAVVRRADGREASLAEFPLAEQLADPETLRAEEVSLSVPDGRSVRMLVNATPIAGEAPETGSVVVTMQDPRAAGGDRAPARGVSGPGGPRAAARR